MMQRLAFRGLNPRMLGASGRRSRGGPTLSTDIRTIPHLPAGCCIHLLQDPKPMDGTPQITVDCRATGPVQRQAPACRAGRRLAEADTVCLRRSRARPGRGRTPPVHRAWRLRRLQSRVRLRSTHRRGNNQGPKPMGETLADVTLENAGDREYCRRGDRAETDIRRTTVDGIVDTGAVTLVLPQNVGRAPGPRDAGNRLCHVRR